MFCMLRGFIWWFNGISTRIQQNAKPQPLNHEVAHAQLIRFRFKSDFLEPSVRRYVTTHHSFLEPEYVLSDNVSLYCMTEKSAVFLEAGYYVHIQDPGQSSHPGKQDECRLIVLPIWAFKKISDRLSKSQG